MDWLNNIVNSVKSLFQPKPADPYAGMNVNTPGNPAYDPVLAQINAHVKQLASTIAPTNQWISQNQQAINSYKQDPVLAMMLKIGQGQNQPQPQPSYPQTANGQQAVQPGRSVAYAAPTQSYDANQTVAIMSLLRNLQSMGTPSMGIPQTLSSTPYTNAANQIAGNRGSLEASVLPYQGVSGQNGSMVS
jgi:hypothetical protein